MASSGNFATMNPLSPTSNNVVYSKGNLATSPGSNFSSTTWCFSNMVIPKDKKIYVEARLSSGAGVYASLAAATNLSTPGSSVVGGDGSVSLYYTSKYVNGTESASWITAASEGDILQLAIDGSNNKVWLGYNNTWGGSGDPANGSNEAGTINTSTALGDDIVIACTQNSVSTMTFNFGQDDTFGGEETAAGNADGNGFGVFKYAPPTNFLALCSGNLSISDDIDPAQTNTDYPGKQFDTILYAGNSGSQDITTLGWQPDLLWFKNRGTTNSNLLFDSSRGATKDLSSDKTNGESTSYSSIFTAFLSTGWRFGEGDAGLNNGSNNYVAWCWKANGGTTSSNSDGNVTSTIQNRKGFSIITYGGSGGQVSGANPTIGHGLGATPDFFIIKNRSANDAWFVWHNTMAANQFGLLNSANAPYNNAANAVMSNTLPSSSVITIANDGDGYNNTSSENYVCYAWCNVEGMQKFGRHTGNANNDGPFIYTGFRPRLIMIKQLEQNGTEWGVYDTARCTFNPNGRFLFWNGANVENDGESFPARALDVTSNGFKIRDGSSGMTNNNGRLHMYAAFGDVPFKYNNTF